MPTENLAILYSAESIIAHKIPNFSDLSPDTRLRSAEPIWSLRHLGHPNWRAPSPGAYTASETIYHPHPTREFKLYYADGFPPQVITIAVPINLGDDDVGTHIPNLGGLPALKQEVATITAHRSGWGPVFYNKGQYFRRFPGTEANKVTFMVVPLKNVCLRGLGGAFWMLVPSEGPNQDLEMDMDEVTGRVVFWGQDAVKRETKVFIGNLV